MHDLLDAHVIRSGSAAFRPRARLIRLLGEELISDETIALVELVKNAYDADARQVIVEFNQLGEPGSATISIRDDGHGMDLDTLLHNWLEPATDYKGSGGRKRRTDLGRYPLGEKGVGRFAADKIGAELELVSRLQGSPEEIVLQVAWHHYENSDYLDKITNRWYVRSPAAYTGDSHGTLLRMRQLRTQWTPELVERVREGLIQLTAPDQTLQDFNIAFDCPDYPEHTGQLANQLINSAPYLVRGMIDATGLFFSGTLPEAPTDLRQLAGRHFILPDGQLREPACGPFTIALNVWDLDLLGLNRAGIDRKVRGNLRRMNGVRIYRDGFRVWPYGERDDDWLELNQRRVNNPTLRVSNNQVIGHISVTQQANPELRDKTSREGLIDTQAFFDLKALAVAVLSVLEEQRFAERHVDVLPVGVAKEVGHDPVLRQVTEAKSSANGSGWKSALNDIERAYRQQTKEFARRYSYVSRLAGLGLAAERMTAAFSEAVTTAADQARILSNELGAQISERNVTGMQPLLDSLDRLNEMLDLMGPLYRPQTQTNEAVDVGAVAQDAVDLFATPLQAAGISATVHQPQPLAVFIERAHLMQVFISLIDNTIRSLTHPEVANPKLQIEVHAIGNHSSVIISDNGPGIAPNLRKLIFQPFYSSRDGMGLGLHVVRDTLALYNSTIDLLDTPALLPGANFRIQFDGRRIEHLD